MIEILKAAAYQGGKVLLTYFRREQLQIKNKSTHQNIVTDADIASQKVIVDSITRSMKKNGFKPAQIGFIGEENLYKDGEYIFVIDPLDGTSNFACGLEQFCINIAVFKAREIIAGVLYVPTSDTFYYAEKGKGAFKEKNGVISTLKMKKKNLKESMIGSYLSSNPLTRKKLFEVIQALIPHVHGLRMMGGNHHLYLVENHFQIVIIGRFWIWDIAPNYLLVKEAEGNIYDWEGRELQLDITDPNKVYPAISCHPEIITDFLALFP